MDVIIRPAAITDLQSILKLNKDLFDHETVFNTEYDLDWTYSEIGLDYFKKVIVDKDKIALVSEINGDVVGYIACSVYHKSFRITNPIAELDNMFVEDSHRGKGIGKKLVAQLMKLLKGMGAKRIKVEAAANNLRAIKFYRSCGFEDFDLILEQSL